MATSVLLPSDLQCQRSTLSRYGRYASPVARTTALPASAVAALLTYLTGHFVTDRDRDRSARAENLLLENSLSSTSLRI